MYQVLPRVSMKHKFYKPKIDQTLLKNKLLIMNGEIFYGDTSFEETLAALVVDRDVRLSVIMDEYLEEHLNFIHSQIPDDMLFVMTQEGGSLDKIKMLEGFSELKDLEIFLKQKYCAEMGLFVNTTHRTAVCLIKVGESDDVALSHLAQSTLPRLVPWIFEAKPVTNEELTVLLEGVEGFSGYVQAIAALAEAKQINKLYAMSAIGKLASIRIESQVKAQQNNIKDLRTDLERRRREMHEILQQIDDAEQQLFSLKYRQQNTDEDDELKTVFSTMSGLELEDVSESDSSITFMVKTYLTNFDPEMINVKNRYFLDSYDVMNGYWFDQDKRIKFLRALLSDNPAFKLKMMARFKIALYGGIRPLDVDGMDGDYLPNAHLQYYHCLGDNEAYIEDCIKKGDWTMAIMQCISAAGSQNLMESTTATKLFRDIFKTQKKVIELPNGDSVTTKAAYEWLVNHHDIKEGE